MHRLPQPRYPQQLILKKTKYGGLPDDFPPPPGGWEIPPGTVPKPEGGKNNSPSAPTHHTPPQPPPPGPTGRDNPHHHNPHPEGEYTDKYKEDVANQKPNFEILSPTPHNPNRDISPAGPTPTYSYSPPPLPPGYPQYSSPPVSFPAPPSPPEYTYPVAPPPQAPPAYPSAAYYQSYPYPYPAYPPPSPMMPRYQPVNRTPAGIPQQTNSYAYFSYNYNNMQGRQTAGSRQTSQSYSPSSRRYSPPSSPYSPPSSPYSPPYPPSSPYSPPSSPYSPPSSPYPNSVSPWQIQNEQAKHDSFMAYFATHPEQWDNSYAVETYDAEIDVPSCQDLPYRECTPWHGVMDERKRCHWSANNLQCEEGGEVAENVPMAPGPTVPKYNDDGTDGHEYEYHNLDAEGEHENEQDTVKDAAEVKARCRGRPHCHILAKMRQPLATSVVTKVLDFFRAGDVEGHGNDEKENKVKVLRKRLQK